MMILALVPIHPLAFVFAAVPTAYHNQVEHSGICFSGSSPGRHQQNFTTIIILNTHAILVLKLSCGIGLLAR